MHVSEEEGLDQRPKSRSVGIASHPHPNPQPRLCYPPVLQIALNLSLYAFFPVSSFKLTIRFSSTLPSLVLASLSRAKNPVRRP